MKPLSRRHFLKMAGTGAAGMAFFNPLSISGYAAGNKFQLNHIFATGMYGNIDVDITMDQVLAEANKVGMTQMDFWGAEGFQWVNEIKKMGKEAFQEKMAEFGVSANLFSLYLTDPEDGLENVQFVHDFGGKIMITGQYPGSNSVEDWLDRWKPAAELAAELNIQIAIENEDTGFVGGFDKIKSFADANPYTNLGIALAPNHIVENQYDPEECAELVRYLGPQLKHFYAWIRECDPWPCPDWESNALQIPGVGPEDFGPPLQALQEIGFTGPVQIFGHGLGDLDARFADTPDETTQYMKTSKAYLDGIADEINATGVHYSDRTGHKIHTEIVNGDLQVIFKEKGKHKIEVFDSRGSVVHSAEVPRSQTVYRFPLNASGPHYIKISGEGIQTQLKQIGMGEALK